MTKDEKPKFGVHIFSGINGHHHFNPSQHSLSLGQDVTDGIQIDADLKHSGKVPIFPPGKIINPYDGSGDDEPEGPAGCS